MGAPRVTGYRVRQMDQPAGYLHWGFILISYPNLILIGIMVLLFIAALLLPFPGHGSGKKKRQA